MSYGWWAVALVVFVPIVLLLQFVGFYTWPLTIVGLVIITVMLSVVLWIRREHKW